MESPFRTQSTLQHPRLAAHIMATNSWFPLATFSAHRPFVAGPCTCLALASIELPVCAQKPDVQPTLFSTTSENPQRSCIASLLVACRAEIDINAHKSIASMYLDSIPECNNMSLKYQSTASQCQNFGCILSVQRKWQNSRNCHSCNSIPERFLLTHSRIHNWFSRSMTCRSRSWCEVGIVM